MNKKIFAILLISIFLIVSIGFISAAEDGDDAGNASNPIKVKIVWKDNGNTAARPDNIRVNLLLGGKFVEFVNLNESNSWNASFKTQSDGGNYKVQLAVDPSNYSVSYNGSAESGFVIKCTLKETPVQKNDTKNVTGNDTNNTTDNNKTTNKTNNSTDNNKTSNKTNNSTDNNKTSNKTNNSTNNNKTSNKTNNSTNNNKTSNKTNNSTNNKTNNNKTNDKTKNQTNDNKAKENIKNQTNNADNNTKKTINKIINKTNSTPNKDEPNNGTSMVTTSKRPANYGDPEFSVNKLRNTGLPIIAVSLIAILGGYAYLRYRK